MPLPFVLVVLLAVFGLLGVHIWAIVDVLRQPDHAWKALGHERAMWLVITIFGGLIGTVVYFAAMRGKLEAIKALPAAGWYPDPGMPGCLRYFDGATWTWHTAALPPGPPR